MTIIVVDKVKGIVAADRFLLGDDYSVARVKKIIRGSDGALAGAAGDSGPCTRFLEWVKDGRRDPFPKITIKNFKAIILTMDRTILSWDDSAIPETLEDDFWAIGSGALVALGARYMGANVWQAVDAACHVTAGACGGGIDQMSLLGNDFFTPLGI